MRGQQSSVTPAGKKPAALTTMEEMWADAAKAFEEICGQSLHRGDVKGFDDVRKKIESAGQASHDPGGGETQKMGEVEERWPSFAAVAEMLVGAASQASSAVSAFLPGAPPLSLYMEISS
jgi:hypothetical protein